MLLSQRLHIHEITCEIGLLGKFQTPDLAIEFEKQVKGWSRKKKEAIIAGEWNKLPELSECMNESHYKNSGKSPFDSAQGDETLNFNRG